MPIVSDRAVDSAEKTAKVLPFGISTVFQYIAAQITVAFCTPIQVTYFDIKGSAMLLGAVFPIWPLYLHFMRAQS